VVAPPGPGQEPAGARAPRCRAVRAEEADASAPVLPVDAEEAILSGSPMAAL